MSGLGIDHVPDILEKAVDVSVNFTNNATDFLIRAALGVSKTRHDTDASTVKKSLNVSETRCMSESQVQEAQVVRLCKDLH